MSFSSQWSEEQIRAEITAIFRSVFSLSEHQIFPFQFLTSIKGCKKLMKPKVSSNFNWGGKEVASLCSTTCLYVMAGIPLPSKNDYVELSDDSDFEDSSARRHRGSNSACTPSDQSARNDDDDSMEVQPSQDQNQATVDLTDFIPVNINEDEAIEEAIRRSLVEDPKQPSQDSKSAKLTKEEVTGILKAHSEKVVSEDFRPIYISRRNVWTTALRQFSRRTFIESRDMLHVTFASDEDQEEAEDLGGPRREFFRLLVKAIYKESGAFEETPKGFIPRLNISHMQNGVYCVIGQMLSTIIVQGGEPPALLAPCVVDLLLTGDIFKIDITPEDLGDKEMRDALNKVDQALTEDDLWKALEACSSWRYNIEGLPNPVTMENKNAFVKKAVCFHVLLQRQSCYDQLAEGLKYYEMLPLLKEKPGLRLVLEMPKGGDVTADDLAAILKPAYSVLGSNKRPKEEIIVVKFRDFLQLVQAKQIGDHLADRNLTEEEQKFVQNLTPCIILAFITGSSNIPAIGFFPSPRITFVHDETKYWPIACTCSNELKLFVNGKNLASTNEFEYLFLVALMNGGIFSTV